MAVLTFIALVLVMLAMAWLDADRNVPATIE